MARYTSPSGFTIIELLVALVIMAIVSSQLLLAFQGQKEAYITNERILDVQEDARLVMDLISTETRMAGFMVPRVAGLTSISGGAATADVFCVSDSNEIADATLATASQPFDRARPLGPIAAGATSFLLQPGDLDIDSDGADDFSAGQALIIADSANSFCAQIQNVDAVATRIDIVATSPLPTGFGTDARIVPAVMYRMAGGGGLGLSRNGLMLSAEVEDLQVEFGVDVNGDSVIDPLTGEFPIHNLAGFDPAGILQVRLTVTTRTTQADPDFTGQFPAAADRPAGAGTDNFRRRRFVASIRPRNLGNQ
jgi:prepilin-type N-terminal cleavage/methylation domain-containing protein